MDYSEFRAKYPAKEAPPADTIPVPPPSTPKVDPQSDAGLRKEALRLAKIQTYKNLYLKEIRHNPEKYLDAASVEEFHELADLACERKRQKHCSAHLVTYNAPHLEPEVLRPFYKSLIRAMSTWSWIKGFIYVLELSKKGRLHLHMVLHQQGKRYPSEIKRQIWTLSHNAHHREYYPWITSPSHTRAAVDVAPIENGKQGVYQTVDYLYKSCVDDDPSTHVYKKGDVSYLLRPAKAPKEEEKIEE